MPHISPIWTLRNLVKRCYYRLQSSKIKISNTNKLSVSGISFIRICILFGIGFIFGIVDWWIDARVLRLLFGYGLSKVEARTGGHQAAMASSRQIVASWLRQRLLQSESTMEKDAYANN